MSLLTNGLRDILLLAPRGIFIGIIRGDNGAPRRRDPKTLAILVSYKMAWILLKRYSAVSSTNASSYLKIKSKLSIFHIMSRHYGGHGRF